MRNLMFAAAGAALVAAASPASAASIITFEAQNGTLVGAFGNLNPFGTNTDTYQFDLSTAGNIFASVGSVGARITFTNLDFTSVKLNGKNFDIMSTGAFELRNISQYLTAGTQTLTVGYRNAQIFSSYAGKLVVSPAVAAVPEPATWAMMLVGFAAIGTVMRYRRRKSAVVFG